MARLEIQAGLGRLLPAKQGQGGGRGKKKGRKTSGDAPPKFSEDFQKQFRKVHRNAPRIDEYRAKVNDYNDALSEEAAAIKSGQKSVTQAKREIKKQEITKKVDWPDGNRGKPGPGRGKKNSLPGVRSFKPAPRARGAHTRWYPGYHLEVAGSARARRT